MRRTIAALLVLLMTGTAAGHAGEEQFNQTAELIASDTPCSELTEEQKVQIGDYYMEQMHPGEMHDIMDEHMGGEGSESLRQAHLDMADRFYCNTASTPDRWGWMPMMGGTWGHGTYMGAGWTGFLLQVALLVLAVLAIIYLYQRITQQREDDD